MRIVIDIENGQASVSTPPAEAPFEYSTAASAPPEVLARAAKLDAADAGPAPRLLAAGGLAVGAAAGAPAAAETARDPAPGPRNGATAAGRAPLTT